MPGPKTREKDLETIIVLAAASLVFYLLSRKASFVWLAGAMLLLGLFSTTFASRLSSVWLRFAEILGGFNTKVILGLVYFMVLMPLSLVFRLVTKKHAASSKSVFGTTYFKVREQTFSPADLEKMW